MSHTSMILTGLMMMTLLVFIAPSIFAINQGRVLRNVALWLAIFLGLTLVYKNFGPEGQNPLFGLPASMSGMKQQDNSSEPKAEDETEATEDAATNESEESPEKSIKEIDNGKDFTPPTE